MYGSIPPIFCLTRKFLLSLLFVRKSKKPWFSALQHRAISHNTDLFLTSLKEFKTDLKLRKYESVHKTEKAIRCQISREMDNCHNSRRRISTIPLPSLPLSTEPYCTSKLNCKVIKQPSSSLCGKAVQKGKKNGTWFYSSCCTIGTVLHEISL